MKLKTSKKRKRADETGDGDETREETTGRKLKRLRERVVLYDGILQSLDAAESLPGMAKDGNLMAELHAKMDYFSALRCLAIARSHSILSNTKNALALLARALEKSSRSVSAVSKSSQSANKAPNLDISTDQAKSLHSLLSGLVMQHRALLELENLTEAAAKQKQGPARPMIERLDEYPAGGVDLKNLVTYPPKLQPIPVKPLFFDFASNYIEYPRLGKKGAVEEDAKAQDGSAGKKRGWFGFGR